VEPREPFAAARCCAQQLLPLVQIMTVTYSVPELAPCQAPAFLTTDPGCYADVIFVSPALILTRF
jgi:hypothetical protein